VSEKESHGLAVFHCASIDGEVISGEWSFLLITGYLYSNIIYIKLG